MSQTTFPKNFYWGAAVAANQCEGAWNVDGKSPSIADCLTLGAVDTPRKITLDIDTERYLYPSHRAVDFYHHYKEDIKLMADMGLKMFRMSISWPRIYPNGNDEKPNQEGLNFYRSVFEELHKYGIEPLVTISHYDDPLYMEEKLGGWQNRETNGLYEKYCHSIFEEYKDLVKYWRHQMNFVSTLLYSFIIFRLFLIRKNLRLTEEFQRSHY